MTQTISAEFPFSSKFIDVLGSRLHYIDEGTGDPILFLHGVPTSSYLWRNIIAPMKRHGRCIAVDLVGFGKSDKPDIAYTIFQHIDYIFRFIEELQLSNITLVVHGWGSVVGFACFARQPQRFKALAFIESHINVPDDRNMVSLPLQELVHVLGGPDGGHDIITNSNYYVNKILPSGVLRDLTQEEMRHYLAPFELPGSSKPIWQYLQELPMGDKRSNVADLITHYSQALQQSDIPKLMFYAVPGYLTTIDTVIWARDHLSNLTLIDIGDGLHYPQESNPALFAEELEKWYCSLHEMASASAV